MARKNDIVEDLGNAIADENAKTFLNDYKKQINTIQIGLIARVDKGLRPTLKSVKTVINVSGVTLNTRSSYVMSKIMLGVLDKPTPDISKLMKLYSVNQPKSFAKSMYDLARNSMKPIPLNNRDKLGAEIFNKIIRENKDALQEMVKTNQKALEQINKDITTNQSKAVIKRRNQLIKERITVNGVTRPLTNDEIAQRLTSEFRDDEARVQRILNTETHRQNELVKEAVARQEGYTKKTWNTQRDSKVRSSHSKLHGKTIEIKKDFNVGGHKASQPSAATLPPEEAINCRCFLTFK